MNPNFEKYLLVTTGASACIEWELIQSLWNDYGNIARCKLAGTTYETVVVKHIVLEEKGGHPRGWLSGHDRKVKSYQIELNWYKEWSAQCNEECRVPQFIGSYKEGKELWIIMEDLKEHFPEIKNSITIKEIKACLKWLANFHGTFLNQKANGLWATGTYWHLETRPDEFEKIENEELKDKAPLIDATLIDCKYQTIVHGDAKLANFCFSGSGRQVAAVDFQYVGGGCGMKDVAYFLGSCLSGDELQSLDDELLDYYFIELEKAVPADINYQELKKEWGKMYPMACADFTRFLLGWMPTHRKVNDYQLNLLDKVLVDL